MVLDFDVGVAGIGVELDLRLARRGLRSRRVGKGLHQQEIAVHVGYPAFLAVGEEFLIRSDGGSVIGEPGQAVHDGWAEQILRPFSWPAFAHGEEGEAAGCHARDFPRRHLACLATAVSNAVHRADHACLAVSGKLLFHGKA